MGPLSPGAVHWICTLLTALGLVTTAKSVTTDGGIVSAVVPTALLEMVLVLPAASDARMAKKYVVLASRPVTVKDSALPDSPGVGGLATVVAESQLSPEMWLVAIRRS